GEPADGDVRVVARELVQERADRVDVAGVVAAEELEGEERGAAGGRALVLEPAPDELALLAVAELPDRAIGDGADAVGRVARGALDLVVPLPPEIRQLPIVTGPRELVRPRGCLGEVHPTVESERAAGPT